MILAANTPNPPAPIAGPTNGVRNVKLRLIANALEVELVHAEDDREDRDEHREVEVGVSLGVEDLQPEIPFLLLLIS